MKISMNSLVFVASGRRVAPWLLRRRWVRVRAADGEGLAALVEREGEVHLAILF